MNNSYDNPIALLNLMKQLMCTLAYSGTPLVFKGENLLLNVLDGKNMDKSLFRLTQDIDANWTQGNPSVSFIVSELSKALHLVDPSLQVVPLKAHIDNGMITFVVMQGAGGLFSIDILIANPVFYCEYTIDGQAVKGATLEKMLADKIKVLSTDIIYRRGKDLFDIYALSHIKGYTTLNILKVMSVCSYVLGNFDCFSNIKKLERAYEQVSTLGERPPFVHVCQRVQKFVYPFMFRTKSNYMWNGNSWVDYQ